MGARQERVSAKDILAEAERRAAGTRKRIAAAKDVIARQEKLVLELEFNRQSTAEAYELLAVMRENLRLLENSLTILSRWIIAKMFE